MTAALVDTLIPGDTDFPGAAKIDLHLALAAHDRFAKPLADIEALLPEGFATDPADARTAALAMIEIAEPALFASLIVGAYSFYYTHPAVAAVIERLTGHTARPPQPSGHPLAPFDAAMVAIPAARAPHYRPTPETPNDP